MKISHVAIASLLALLLSTGLGGCPSSSTTTTGDETTDGTTDTTDSTTLTAVEQDAVTTAVTANESLGQAVNTTQSTTGGDDESSLEIPTGTQTRNFGLCPEVSMKLANDGLVTFDMTIDFGDGCAPADSPNFTCSGYATGTFSQQAKSLNVTFSNISCNEATLEGDVNATYDVNNLDVALSGDWDLTYTDSVGSVLTDGNGTGSYSGSTLTTTVETFTGTISDTVYSWNATIDNVKMSYATYGNGIPFSGQTSVSGDGIRTTIVRFSANSPTTGIVEVSIDGGAHFFEVNLYAL
ncbi:MAG: hypothetical protein JXO22_03120 [Phycisphaerae bacterium]|nr:hypothetical protein [Phycisphaerae bacterium]